MSSKREKLLTVGELASSGGVTVRTLQYYDAKGILVPSAFSEGGRRMYNKRDIIRLQQIVFLKSMGFSLEEIRDRILPAESAEELERMFKNQKRVLGEQISHIQETVNNMEKIIAELKQGNEIDTERLFLIMRASQVSNPFYFMPRNISRNQMEHLFSSVENERVANELNKSFQTFSTELIEIYKQNEKPEGEKGQMMADRWWQMMLQLAKGDIAFIQETAKIFKNDSNWPSDMNEIKESVNVFLRQAIIIYCENNNIKLSRKKKEKRKEEFM